MNYEYFGRNIIIIGKYFKLFLKENLKEYNLNSAEGLVLLSLYGKNNRTLDEITQELQFDKGVMTRTMKSLENKGYVVRHKNPDDSRSFIFCLTDKSIEFKPSLVLILKEWTELLFNNIDEKSIEFINELVIKMKENAIKKLPKNE